MITPPVQTDKLGVVLRIFSDARVGENYIEPLQAKGGVPPYTFALGSETLPAGLQVVGSAVAGVPTEAGRFSAIVEVTDAEGSKATGAISVRVLDVDAPDPVTPMPMLPSSRCDAPTFLELGDSARITASLPASAAEYADTACGLSDRDAATFFVIPVSADSKLTLALQSSDSNVRAGWLANRCPSASALSACGDQASIDVVAGNYLLLVAGTPGASFVLELTRENSVPPPPPGPPSCDNPTPIDLSSGSAVMAGSFDELLSENSGTCTYGYKEAVFEVTLDEPADLRISSTSGGLGLYLRSGACDFGREVACRSYEPIYLPNTAAGTYYLFVDQQWSDQLTYSVLVEKLPATPRPSNDTCGGAIPLTFVNDRATVTANLTAAVSTSYFTGCTYGRAAFYTFELTEPRLVRLRSTSSNFSMELGQGSCLAPQSVSCGDGYSDLCAPDVLPAGTYWVSMYERWSQIPAINSLTVELSDPPVAPANDLCENARDATPGSSGTLTLSGVLDGAENEYTGPAQCVYSGAYPEVYYTVEVTERSDLTATVTSNSYGLAAYVVGGGCAAPDEVQCLSSYGSTMYGIEPGTYGIVVENTQSASYNHCPVTGASFQLTVELQPSRPQPSNDLCVGSSTIALSAVGSILSIIGTTQGAADEVSSLLCPNSYSMTTAGADVFYKIITGETGRIAVSVNAVSPVVVSLHGATCDTSGAFACSGWGNSFETLAPFPAGEYYVRVDHDTGYSSSYTPTDFVLTAQLLP